MVIIKLTKFPDKSTLSFLIPEMAVVQKRYWDLHVCVAVFLNYETLRNP